MVESNNIFYEFNEIQDKGTEEVTYEELLANVNCAMSLCIDLTRRRWMSV